MIFAGFWLKFAGFPSPDGAEIQENPIRQAKFRELATRSVAKSEPRAPKSGPEAPKESPRTRQGGQVGGQEGPRGAPGGVPRRPGETSETISALRKAKKSSFASSLWRESREMRLRFNLSLIFEACAQTRKCKKHVKLIVFSCFS